MSKIGWRNIIVEGYCMYGISIHKDKYDYEVISTEPFKTKKVKNPYYDPKFKFAPKPGYCKKMITQHCLLEDCPHLAISDVPKKMYPKMMDKIQELYDDSENDDWDDE